MDWLTAARQALTGWRISRDIAEARDARLKFARLQRECDAIEARRAKHWSDRDKAQIEADARWRAERGIHFEPFRKGGAWGFWKDPAGRILESGGSAPRIDWPALPPLTRHELLTYRDRAVYYQHVEVYNCRQSLDDCWRDWRDQRNELRELRLEHRSRPHTMSVNAASSSYDRPIYMTEAQYNSLAGIPGRDEIVCLGPA